jgi:hypothetical protein
MDQQIKKFLEFNGKTIYFLAKDGQYWIAVKPICEALGVDYIQQFKNVKKEKILAGALCKHTIHDTTNRLQEMVCLPEFYIYGWLFSVRSGSKGLEAYKWKCYEVLYNHFHGTIGGRKDLIREEVKIQLERDRLINELSRTPEYIQLQELNAKSKKIKTDLRLMDNSLFTEQLSLFAGT